MNRTRKLVFASRVGLPVLAVGLFTILWAVLLHRRREDILSSGVVAWWTALCVLSVCNVSLWRLAIMAATRRRATVEPAISLLQRQQLQLSAVYVFGCGFRSILPRADVQRLSLIDSWLSSVLVGRSVATAAELCFMAQWALLLHHVAHDARSRSAAVISWLIVPLIAVAEVCSWYATLTTCYLGNVLEESIWTLSASLLLVGCLAVWPRCLATRKPFLAAVLGLGVVYVLFMAVVDVPMYVSRWQADETMGRNYLTLSQGLQDAWSRRVVTFAWEEWRAEIPWMTLYFSVCVWWSLALVHVPRWWPCPRLGTAEYESR